MKEISILVVEDEAIVAADLQHCIEALGYTVFAVAGSGEDALPKVSESKPDLVLMDISLGGEFDGIETAGRLRDLYDLPVVYLSAYSDAETLERAKITQPYGYLLKPLDEREVVTTIEMAIHKHSMERERELLVAELERALDEVKTLRGLLPICCQCKKIRNSEDSWVQIEKYISTHTDAIFTHCYCPECCKKAEEALVKLA